ncbi:phage lysozyme family protein [Burkholderia pseudomallei]|nr:phage lysozyme family protein [Burkholderia pseudomallei]
MQGTDSGGAASDPVSQYRKRRSCGRGWRRSHPPRASLSMHQLAAAVSFAYNVGANAYCASTTARRFNAGDLRGACRAINEADSGRPQWVTARGRVLPGLVKRRAEERAICERGL